MNTPDTRTEVEIETRHDRPERYEPPAIVYRGKLEAHASICNSTDSSCGIVSS